MSRASRATGSRAKPSYLGRRFELIDTGGIIPNDAEMIPTEILKQARVALDQAAQIIFLIDGRTEITGADRDLAKVLRKLGKPVTLAVNKIDATVREGLAHEFHSLGFKDLFPISAEHRIGFDELLEHVTKDFKSDEGPEEPQPEKRPIKVAIIGRPNVGKSTLLNALVGQERAIVSPVAGTTRDAVDQSLVHDGVEYVFVDTAGIRRKGKTKLMAEKLSVVMARRHIRMANVVLLVLDATEGVRRAGCDHRRLRARRRPRADPVREQVGRGRRQGQAQVYRRNPRRAEVSGVRADCVCFGQDGRGRGSAVRDD